jgi:hypothetical protein
VWRPTGASWPNAAGSRGALRDSSPSARRAELASPPPAASSSYVALAATTKSTFIFAVLVAVSLIPAVNTLFMSVRCRRSPMPSGRAGPLWSSPTGPPLVRCRRTAAGVSADRLTEGAPSRPPHLVDALQRAADGPVWSLSVRFVFAIFAAS